MSPLAGVVFPSIQGCKALFISIYLDQKATLERPWYIAEGLGTRPIGDGDGIRIQISLSYYYALISAEILPGDLFGYRNISMARSLFYRAGSEDYSFQSQRSSPRCSVPAEQAYGIYSTSEASTQLRFLCLFSNPHAALRLRTSITAAILLNKGPRNTGNA